MSWLLLALLTPAWAQPTPPARRIPPSVLDEVRLLENRFDGALYADCDPTRCFAKGCTYLDHVVADRPRNASLPGLGQDVAPSPVEVQEVLTRATCAFAYEDTVPPADARNLVRRLQEKLSSGWLTVEIAAQRLPPLPPSLRDPAPEEVDTDTDTDLPPPPPEPEKPAWSIGRAAEELWATLLPHAWWMVLVAMGTVAAAALIWSIRRLGADSIEDRLLLAESGRAPSGPEPTPAPAVATVEGGADEAFALAQEASWSAKFHQDPPDDEARALVRELLVSRSFDLLAQAALRFPDAVPAAFPDGVAGGEIATAKLAFAEYLKGLDPTTLPDDATFFRTLNRHALSASVASQSDASTVRSLRDDFGTAGLASLIAEVPPRTAALLFALSPASRQDELVRLVEPTRLAALADQLLRSNRVSPSENRHLLEVLAAARADRPLPRAPAAEVSDRGEVFDAATPLSVLFEAMHPDRRTAILGEALQRTHGALPDWTRGILFSDLLLALDPESRADLFLEVEAVAFAAWIGLLDREVAEALLEGAPSALRTTVRASSDFGSREAQIAAAARGRAALAKALQAALARAGRPFSSVLSGARRGSA